jgi:putative hydrolase of the HAD superfamily
MARSFDAVCFDFAGTLFSDRALRDVHLQQLRFVARAAGVDATDGELRTAYRQGLGAASAARTGRTIYAHRDLFADAFVALATALGGAIEPAVADEAVDRQYHATVESAVLRDDAADTLRALRDRGVHVQIVSNIDDDQFEPMVERLGLRQLVDATTTSDEAGSCKPDRRIFELALGKAGCPATRALFVGDTPSHDIVGAAAVGMRTAWLAVDARPGTDAGAPDHVIHALAEVLDVVGR